MDSCRKRIVQSKTAQIVQMTSGQFARVFDKTIGFQERLQQQLNEFCNLFLVNK